MQPRPGGPAGYGGVTGLLFQSHRDRAGPGVGLAGPAGRPGKRIFVTVSEHFFDNVCQISTKILHATPYEPSLGF